MGGPGLGGGVGGRAAGPAVTHSCDRWQSVRPGSPQGPGPACLAGGQLRSFHLAASVPQGCREGRFITAWATLSERRPPCELCVRQSL